MYVRMYIRILSLSLSRARALSHVAPESEHGNNNDIE